MAALDPRIAEFLARLVRLDPAVLVRVREGEVWGSVPWGVLVTRTARVAVPDTPADITVSAAAWLDHGGDPAGLDRQDAGWRAGLPAGIVVVRETMPTSVVRELGQAAEATFRETVASGIGGRAVGSRMLRDALLDHVPITVITRDGEWGVPQRLVQAVARTGLLAANGDVPLQVVSCGAWIGLDTTLGRAWWRPPMLTMSARRTAHGHSR